MIVITQSAGTIASLQNGVDGRRISIDQQVLTEDCKMNNILLNEEMIIYITAVSLWLSAFILELTQVGPGPPKEYVW